MRTYIPKATCNMSRYSNIKFHNQVKHIQTQLSKPEYSNVVPTPAQVLPLLEKFYAYYEESLTHNYSNVGARNGLRRDVYNMVRRQCACVNGLAQDDLVYIDGSGFELNQPAHKHPVPDKGKVISITPMNTGEAAVSFKGIQYRDWYETVVTSSNGFKQSTISSQTTVYLKDLPVNESLTVTMRAVNSSGAGLWCAPIYFALAQNAGAANNNEQELKHSAANNTLGNYPNGGNANVV